MTPPATLAEHCAALAQAIVQRNWTLAMAIDPRFGIGNRPELFSETDWCEEAKCALDNGDFNALETMLAEERANQTRPWTREETDEMHGDWLADLRREERA